MPDMSDDTESSVRNASTKYYWDPFNSPDWDSKPIEVTCSRRLLKEHREREMNDTHGQGVLGVRLFTEEDNLNHVIYQLIGPNGTPYEKIPFHFFVRIGPQYPFRCPRMKFLDAPCLPVRISPCMYRNGKLCLSTIDTWQGCNWPPHMNLHQLAISVRSILGTNPLLEDPVFGSVATAEESALFNKMARHESLWMFASRLEDLLNPTAASFASEEQKLVVRHPRVAKGIILEFTDHCSSFFFDCIHEAHSKLEGITYSEVMKESKWYDAYLKGADERKFQWRELAGKFKALFEKAKKYRTEEFVLLPIGEVEEGEKEAHNGGEAPNQETE